MLSGRNRVFICVRPRLWAHSAPPLRVGAPGAHHEKFVVQSPANRCRQVDSTSASARIQLSSRPHLHAKNWMTSSVLGGVPSSSTKPPMSLVTRSLMSFHAVVTPLHGSTWNG